MVSFDTPEDFRQIIEIVLAALDVLVGNNTVKAFLAEFQPLDYAQIGVGCAAQTVEHARRGNFGLLDTL